MVHSDGTCALAQETAGMCAHHLQVVSLHVSDLVVWGIFYAGQGAHREVGSEGFEANHRAVAENGEPVGQKSRRYRAGTMAAKEILGVSRCTKVCADGTVGKKHVLPREISYDPISDGCGYLCL